MLFAQIRIPVGDSLAVELPALDRAALVRIQVPQPDNILISLYSVVSRGLARNAAKLADFSRRHCGGLS
jgi:hypothetical protein